MARMLTLDGPPRSPAKVDEAAGKDKAKRKAAIDNHADALAEAMIALAAVGEANDAVRERARLQREERRIRMSPTQQRRQEQNNLNRAVRDIERVEASRGLNVRADDAEFARLFPSAIPTRRLQAKPPITVWEALRHVAQHGNTSNELLSVARDMASRSDRALSEKQFSYAKSICLKPRNRALLEATYDLTNMNRERFTLPTGRHQGGAPVNPLAGKIARFPVLANSFTEAAGYYVSFTYYLSKADGGRKEATRSCMIPTSVIQGIRPPVNGGLSHISVDAMWLRTQRGLDPQHIKNCVLENA